MKSSPLKSNGVVRAAFYGNICNNFYQIVKALRQFSDIDAHLFIDETSDPQQRPESDDPMLYQNYPDWIHTGRYAAGLSILAPWTSPLVSEMKNFDIVVVSALGPLFTPFAKKPSAFFTTGGDLTIYPFPIEFRFLYPSLRAKIWSWSVGFWQRRGIRRMTEIWTRPFSPFTDALAQLEVSPERLGPTYCPFLIDPETFKRDTEVRQKQNPLVKAITDRFDFVLFHPSRFMMRDLPSLRRTGQWKRNDVLLHGFAQFLKESQAPRAGLVLWLKPEHPFGFTRHDMISLYSVANVVSDDFGVGWFGSVVLEACSTECAVVTHVDESSMKRLYPWHPIQSAKTPEEVCSHVAALYRNPEECRQIGIRGRQWIKEFHAEKAGASAYVKRITESIRKYR